MRSRILFVPEFSDLTMLADVLGRAAFHLAHVEPEALTFVVESGLGDAASEALGRVVAPGGFDRVTRDQIGRVLDRVVVVEAGTPQAERIGGLSDVVAVWDSAAFDRSEWVLEAGRRVPRHSIFDVDPTINPGAPAEFGALADKLAPSSPAAERSRFSRMVRAIGGAHHVFVTSEAPADVGNISDGLRIASGAAIAHLDRIQPQLAVLTDPTLHFGPSSEAARARSALLAAMARDSGLWVVVPIDYRAFLVDRIPQQGERIIGIPQLEAGAPVALDLQERFGVPVLPTELAVTIPLAATLGHSISVEAYRTEGDGDEEPVLSDAGSAAVELLVEACEAEGIRVEGHGSSSVPPLLRRMAHPDPVVFSPPEALSAHVGPALVWIDPDWISDYGHYGHWYRALADEAEGEGVPIVALAARGVDAPDRKDVLPTFTYPTVNPRAATLYAPRFEAELVSAVTQLLEKAPDASLILAFFTADVWHLPPLIRVASRFPARVSIVANLMRSHRELLEAARAPEAELAWWAQSFRGLVELGRAVGVTVTVDSDELARVVADSIQIELPVWPLTAPPLDAGESMPPQRDEVVFFSSGQPQHAKGAIEFADAAILMLSGPWGQRATFRMRFVEQPTGTDYRMLEAIERAEAAGVEIVRGLLSYEDHVATLRDADVIVVPYRVDPFRTRTNATVVDAMRAGKPVVVAAGTWAAQVAGSIGTSVEFRSGDAADLARAMSEAANRLPALAERARHDAGESRERFAMSGLFNFIMGTDSAKSDADPEAIAETASQIDSVFAAYSTGRADTRRIERLSAAGLAEKLGESLQAGERLQDQVESRDRRIHHLERAAEDVKKVSHGLATELEKANLKAADLERTLTELAAQQREQRMSLLARVKRRLHKS